MYMRNSIFAGLILMITVFSACRRGEDLGGFWSATVKFSAHETQHMALALREDSTFYFISRPNEGMPWKLQFGIWSMNEGDILLKGEQQFSLWLRPVKNQLELLDYEGNEVLSGKPVRLSKSKDTFWNQEISVVMTGKVVELDGQRRFLPCGSFRFIPLVDEPANGPQITDNQAMTVMLAFVPSGLYGKQATGVRIGNVFGPAACE